MGSQANGNAAATDPDGDTLTFSLGPNAPAGAGITAGGAFTWTPLPAQAGSVYNVKIIVTDNSVPALVDSQTIAITVDDMPEVIWSVDNPGYLLMSRLSLILLDGLKSPQ